MRWRWEGNEKKNGRTRRRTADASEATEKEEGRESGESERQRRNGGGRRKESGVRERG